MKLSDDQKRSLRWLCIYLPAYAVGYPFIGLLYGQTLSWGAFLISFSISAVIGLLFLPFIIWGMKIPTEDADNKKE